VSEVLRLHGLGAVVDVRCTGSAAAELEAAMRVAWSRCLVPPDNAPVEAPPLDVRLDDPAELPRRMMLTTQRVTRSLIGARAGQLLMFHAGAVGDPQTGRTLVYVAKGGTGKTTLSRLLGQRFGYVTDETVGIDASGTIHPYPKPLSVRRPDANGLKDEVSPDELSLLAPAAEPHLAQLILLDRAPSAGSATLEELPFMDALFGLVEQTSSLSALPRPLHALADLVEGTNPVLRLRYREAVDAAAELSALIAGQG
jgi:hypothetical protein